MVGLCHLRFEELCWCSGLLGEILRTMWYCVDARDNLHSQRLTNSDESVLTETACMKLEKIQTVWHCGYPIAPTTIIQQQYSFFSQVN